MAVHQNEFERSLVVSARLNRLLNHLHCSTPLHSARSCSLVLHLKQNSQSLHVEHVIIYDQDFGLVECLLYVSLFD